MIATKDLKEKFLCDIFLHHLRNECDLRQVDHLEDERRNHYFAKGQLPFAVRARLPSRTRDHQERRPLCHARIQPWHLIAVG